MNLRHALIALVAFAGCMPIEDERRVGPGTTPGDEPWNHDDQVSCQSSDECGSGEVCESGVCQMARCLESFESRAPLGKSHYFGTDGELAIISDARFIDGFEPGDGGYLTSWELSAGDKVLDVTAGDLVGSKPHTIAVALEYSDVLALSGPAGEGVLALGIWPRAIASGDVDLDGLDEVVAFSAEGEIRVCHVDEGVCDEAVIEGAAGKDVAVADVDGDGRDEALFLFDYEGESELVVWNLDAAETGQEESYGWHFNIPVRAMAAGRLSGAPAAEVAMLEDGGWWGWSADRIHVFAPAEEAFVASADVDGYTIDVAVGDRDSDDLDEIAVLRESHEFEILALDGGAIQSESVWPIAVGEAAERISFVDWDGDSAWGELIEGPELVAGDAVPVAALMFPPYDQGVANGTSSINLGNSESHEESKSDTISLSVGIGVSFGGEALGFKAKVGASLEQSVKYRHSVASSVSIGSRYGVTADPLLEGDAYAPVVLSCGCYHRYRYRTDDPANRIGGSGQTVDIYIPVGGQTQLWSSKRYNAMAEASGRLPIIEVPIKVGQIDSYPAALSDLYGNPIPAEDVLFPNTPIYQASDVGEVFFWLERGESTTNETCESTKLGVSASFGAGGVSLDGSVSLGVESGYSITVGSSQLFAGGIPSIPNDPETPEDEFALYRYGFQPTVFRQHYIDAHGDPAAFYVLHYAVPR
jgi:hypothetical protein